MFESLADTALSLLSRYGYLALFAFMFLETSLLFPFLPSEVVVPAAAALLVAGPATFALFAATATAGATAGSLFAYHLFDAYGRDAAEKYGRYVHVSAEDIDRADRWFHRWGESSVFWGRLLPVLRSIISIPAGFAGMNRRKFLLYSAAGSLCYAVGVAAAVRFGLSLP